MSATPHEPRLAPGSDGVPLLGETLSFAKSPFRFIEERLAKHGRIFRSRVLGRRTVVVAGPEAAARFIDDTVVMREGSMPPHVQELFGGRSLPLLDGEVHKARKGLVIQAFTRGHRCPGLDYATYMMEIFTIALLRDYTWQLPPQSFEMNWSKTPPEPKDGLRARVEAKAESRRQKAEVASR